MTAVTRPDGIKAVLLPVRELKVFGKKVQPELSTALGFSPQMLVMVVSNLSWNQLVETWAIKEYRAARAWVRSVEDGSRMQSGTQRALEKAFEPLEGDVGRPWTPEELRDLQGARAAPWRILFRQLRRQMRRESGAVERHLLTRLAFYDRFAHRLPTLMGDPAKLQQKVQFLVTGVNYWQRAGFNFPMQASMVLDTTLQHLAWLDTHLRTNGDRPWAGNPVTSLSEPSKESMRHWFDGLLKQTKCADLMEFYKFLGARGVVSRNKVISHDKLKKWASTQELMPHHAVLVVLEGCQEKIDRLHEHYRLWFARLLTFLCDFISAFNAEPIADKVAREAVHMRLCLLRDGFQAT